ncbi:MAG: hypothetical protein FJ100_07030 [Deltaproteobacteria bacterium]|nr:hypothetical protein [Deltaproteobacteria bacterium]
MQRTDPVICTLRTPTTVAQGARLDRSAWQALAQGLSFAFALGVSAAGCAGRDSGPMYTVYAGSDVDDAGRAAETGQADASAPGSETVGTAPIAALPPGDPIEIANNGAYFGRARDVIQTAQKKLRIVQFEVTQGDGPQLLVAATIKAHQRGVDVRVLLDEEVPYNADALAQLKAAGVQAKYDSPKLRTHAKVVASEQGFVVGSTNWSTPSMTKNNETNVLVRDPAAVTQLHAWIDKLWADSGKSQPMVAGKSTVAPLYADGGYAAVVGPLVDAAKTRIWLCTYGMNLDPANASSPVTQLAQKVAAAHQRGVQVRIALDQSGDWAELGNDVNADSAAHLVKMGLDVRSDPKSVVTHAKFVVVDDAVVLGSNNWGYGGMQAYHEIGCKTVHAPAVAGLADYFDKLWTVSTPFAP